MGRGDPGSTVFLFDFDGTITSVELLPLIAETFGVDEDIAALTRDTMAGRVPFDSSFRTRVGILGSLPPDEVAAVVESAPAFPRVLDWIVDHRDRCWVVTGNLDCWVDRWMRRHGLNYFASTARVEGGRTSVERILYKETVLERFRGRRTVAVGDGANDAQLIADADVGIGAALLHDPPPVVLEVADWLVMEEAPLCRTLSRL